MAAAYKLGYRSYCGQVEVWLDRQNKSHILLKSTRPAGREMELTILDFQKLFGGINNKCRIPVGMGEGYFEWIPIFKSTDDLTPRVFLVRKGWDEEGVR
jgi:hypothetical protein